MYSHVFIYMYMYSYVSYVPIGLTYIPTFILKTTGRVWLTNIYQYLYPY